MFKGLINIGLGRRIYYVGFINLANRVERVQIANCKVCKDKRRSMHLQLMYVLCKQVQCNLKERVNGSNCQVTRRTGFENKITRHRTISMVFLSLTYNSQVG